MYREIGYGIFLFNSIVRFIDKIFCNHLRREMGKNRICGDGLVGPTGHGGMGAEIAVKASS